MSNLNATLAAQVNTQKAAIALTIPSLTTTALCKTHIGNIIDHLALEDTDASQRGLWFDMIPIEARISLLALLQVYESAIV